MYEISRIEYAEKLLSPKLASASRLIGTAERKHISELRIRKGRGFSAVLYGKEYFITSNGTLMNNLENAVTVESDDIVFTFNTAFKGSVHSFPRELAQGFITCEGGNRAGFCGTAVCDSKSFEVKNIKDISSVNIRIAREIKGCSQEIYDKAFSDGITSLVIASPPNGGKTTILRDLCRLLGENYAVSVIDERGELACVTDGISQNDIGARCDVFNGYPKSDAIITAVKVMSPKIIVCDEIGSKEDFTALEYAVNSGVKLVCTCHASSYDELRKRPVIGRLIKDSVFDNAAILGTGSLCGKLTAFYKLKK